jgi:choline/glycine/proline betaine transport protein
MTVFGDTGIHMVLYQGLDSLAATVKADSSLALFALLEQLPWSMLLSMIAVVMVVVFFVTSADSGALVLDMLSSRSHKLGDSPLWQRLFWSTLVGVVAATLLLADGLKALQTATIASAMPFAMILLAAMWGLFKALRLDAAKREFHQIPSSSGGSAAGTVDWQLRLHNLATLPERNDVKSFIAKVVMPACKDVCSELQKQGLHAEVTFKNSRVWLDVSHGIEADFHYEVRPHGLEQPSFSPLEGDEGATEAREYYRAEVHLAEGGLDYDIMGWTRDAVIGDIIDQYERHLQFLHRVR